jgi:hypothetical protein
MRCPQCKNRVLQKSGNITRVRTQGPVTFDADGTCRAQCYWCKSPITLPVSLDDEASIPEERFIIPSPAN